jgi:hypothetical protein
MEANANMAVMRRAYERGQWLRALQKLGLVVPLCAFALFMTQEPTRVAIASVVLAIGTVVLWWRGQDLGRGASVGLLAGLMPMLLPLFTRSNVSCCMAGNCWSVCMVACIVGGVTAGGLVAYFARTREFGFRGLAACAGVASVTGALGCAMAGTIGILSMVLAMAVVSTPVLLWARARA